MVLSKRPVFCSNSFWHHILHSFTLFFFRLSLLTTRGCSFVSHSHNLGSQSLMQGGVMSWWSSGVSRPHLPTSPNQTPKSFTLFCNEELFQSSIFSVFLWPQATEQEVPWPGPWTHHSPQTSLNNTLTWCVSVFRAQNENDNLSLVSQWYRHKERSSVL